MSGSVSMVDGHIDPDKKEITPQQAIKYFEDEILMLENAPNLNGCEMTDEWREQLKICKMAKEALEKQIPKKPMTRFDCIKAMSIDEMAVVLERNANCEKFCVFTTDGVCDASGNVCLEGITRWLESEVEEE